MNQALYAITVHRPWAYAIAHLGKACENRTWNCRLQPGTWLAIHAGKRFDRKGAEWIVSELGLALPDGGGETGIVAIARFQANITSSSSPWFFGPVGWQLDRVVPVEPVPINGQQGLWRVPDGLAANLIAIAAKASEVKP